MDIKPTCYATERSWSLFFDFYLILIDHNLNKLREDLLPTFSTFQVPFKFNLWHNFAINFRDPTFCENLRRIDKPLLGTKISEIFKKLCNILELVLERSNLFTLI
jgi:hypothetical protein